MIQDNEMFVCPDCCKVTLTWGGLQSHKKACTGKKDTRSLVEKMGDIIHRQTLETGFFNVLGERESSGRTFTVAFFIGQF